MSQQNYAHNDGQTQYTDAAMTAASQKTPTASEVIFMPQQNYAHNDGQTQDINAIAKAALFYAQQWKLHLVPCWGVHDGKCLCGDKHCDNPGKHPIFKDWLEKATNDVETVRQWLQAYPEANIAHVPGKRGLVVIDLDIKNNPNVVEEFLDWLAAFGLGLDDFGEWCVQTPSGGYHYYLRAPVAPSEICPYTVPWSKIDHRHGLPKGVEFLSGRHLVHLPPSETPKGRYQWNEVVRERWRKIFGQITDPEERFRELFPEMPQKLWEWCYDVTKDQHERTQVATHWAADPEALQEWLKAHPNHKEVADLLIENWPRQQGNRHDLALALAGGLLRDGVPKEIIPELIGFVAKSAGDREWKDRRRAAIDTAQRYESNGEVTGWQTALALGFPAETINTIRRLLRQANGNGTPPSNGHHFSVNEPFEYPTDYLHGQIVVSALKDYLRWVPVWGWMRWNGQRWERVNEEVIYPKVAEVLRDHYLQKAQEALQQAKEVPLNQQSDYFKQAALYFKWTAQAMSATRVKHALQFAKAGLEDSPQHFDANPYLLNTQSGVLNLQTGELYPHDPSFRLTHITNAPYDPNAKAERWEQFLREIFNNNDQLIAYVQRLFGYALLGRNEQRLFVICWGEGANGKTVFLSTIAYVLGSYAKETPADTFLEDGFRRGSPRNDLARLVGVRLVTSSETKEGQRLDPGQLKHLTGGDPVTARFLFHEFFEFVPQFLPVLRTNNKPDLPGYDEAVWDRVRLIPFPVRIPKENQDPGLGEKLKEEAPGILRWLVEGCRAYLEKRSLEDPEEVQVATKAYRLETDAVYRFFEETTEPAPDGRLLFAEVRERYREWAEQEGAPLVSDRILARVLQGLGCQRIRGRDGTKKVIIYHGRRWKNEDPDRHDRDTMDMMDTMDTIFAQSSIERFETEKFLQKSCPSCPSCPPATLPVEPESPMVDTTTWLRNTFGAADWQELSEEELEAFFASQEAALGTDPPDPPTGASTSGTDPPEEPDEPKPVLEGYLGEFRELSDEELQTFFASQEATSGTDPPEDSEWPF